MTAGVVAPGVPPPLGLCVRRAGRRRGAGPSGHTRGARSGANATNGSVQASRRRAASLPS
jgi:hypothetical protein